MKGERVKREKGRKGRGHCVSLVKTGIIFCSKFHSAINLVRGKNTEKLGNDNAVRAGIQLGRFVLISPFHLRFKIQDLRLGD